MRLTTVVCFLVLTALVMPLGSSAQAQFSAGEPAMGGIVGTGSSTIDRLPETFRLQLLITAEGKDVKDALAKLKARESAVKTKLAELGATGDSISFSDPQPQDANQRQQLEQMMRMRMGGRQPAAAAKNVPAMTLSATLKAEWPLSANDTDALLIESQELQAKIKAANLAVDKSDKVAAAEQEEAIEESRGSMGGDGQMNPRDPVFLFVAKISDEQRDQARAAAFKDARDEAARLAKAANVELGQLRLLAANAAPNFSPDQMYDGGYQQRMAYGMMQRQQAEGGKENSEAIGMQPGKVSYRVMVYVSFSPKGQ